jgi:Fe-S oxidoreductases
MASPSIRPCLVVADEDGNIYDDPSLLMLCRKGEELSLPKPEEIMPLPEESELFLLPARYALGLDPETGQVREQNALCVAAFAAPAHTLTAHPAFAKRPDAPLLPLFAYGAVGFANERFYICAKKVDDDPRQIFSGISKKHLRREAMALKRAFPDNRLVQHLMDNCALTYSCPAAKNFCLGRYEAPLPTSRACNARCIGCISHKDRTSPLCATPQDRLAFTPTAEEIAEVMRHHASRAPNPIFSFGQGCEGEPLTEAPLLAKAIGLFRASGGIGTINLNSNASLPDAVQLVAKAGLTSLRVSLNSAREEPYLRYYRPVGYTFADVRESIRRAKGLGVYVSLNLLFFPGINDTENELEALLELVTSEHIDCIQLRNLNIDPDYYLEILRGLDHGPSCGMVNFRKRLKKNCPWLHIGYFNPFVPEAATAREQARQ